MSFFNEINYVLLAAVSNKVFKEEK